MQTSKIPIIDALVEQIDFGYIEVLKNPWLKKMLLDYRTILIKGNNRTIKCRNNIKIRKQDTANSAGISLSEGPDV